MGGFRHMHSRYGRRLPLSHQNGLLLARLSWSVPTLTVVLSTVLHVLGNPRDVPFFISETDQYGLQDHVFSWGLTIGGVCQMLYAWHLYHTLEAQRPRLWFIASIIGIFSSLNAILVAHFDMYDFMDPHILTAMFAFGGGVLWAMLALPSLGTFADSIGHRFRTIGFFMAFLGFIIMIGAFQPVANSFDSTGMTLEEFLNRAQSGIDIAAPAEYILVAGLMVCLASFHYDLVKQRLIREDENNEADRSIAFVGKA